MDTARSVVITGASTGIGAACALHLDRMGWRVFAGVRRQADAEALRTQGSTRLTAISLDVTDTVSISTAPAPSPGRRPPASRGWWRGSWAKSDPSLPDLRPARGSTWSDRLR
jgi:hypothetical protein